MKGGNLNIIKKTINNVALTRKKQMIDNICDFDKLIKLNNSNNKSKQQLKFDNHNHQRKKEKSLIENIMIKLNCEQQKIISNNFIDKNENLKWYLDYWSKSTYYKIYNEALNKFIYLMFKCI